jgi:CheY-like chemotaxis protein
MKNTILIVDDDERNIFALSAVLASKGFRVLFAMDGKSGVEVATSEHIDLILMDLIMPIMGGYEAMYHLRKRKISENIPIIVLTTNESLEEKDKCLKMGANAYFAKPISIENLMVEIGKLINAPNERRTA